MLKKFLFNLFLCIFLIFRLFPTVPPRIHHISSGGHMQVKKGASVRIECSASGKRHAFIYLFIQICAIQILFNLILIGIVLTCFFFIEIFSLTGNPSPNITWTRKFENLPNGKKFLPRTTRTNKHVLRELKTWFEISKVKMNMK